jgi:predicted cupin superfamily sugar epimerase
MEGTEGGVKEDHPSATAHEIVESLALQPHPEGGYFRETYRSGVSLRTARGERSLATAILFLITAGQPSRWHRLAADELWVHQAGASLELLMIDKAPAAPAAENRHPAAGVLRTAVLGRPASVPASDLELQRQGAPQAPGGRAVSCQPQALVPAGTWQAARVVAVRRAPRVSSPPLPDPEDELWALVTCVVTPGFDYRDFELGRRETLLAAHGALRETIVELT